MQMGGVGNLSLEQDRTQKAAELRENGSLPNHPDHIFNRHRLFLIQGIVKGVHFHYYRTQDTVKLMGPLSNHILHGSKSQSVFYQIHLYQP